VPLARSRTSDDTEMPIDGLDLDLSSYVVHGAKFEAPTRYNILEPVGQGAYGVVCSAHDKEKDEPCAIKKIENAFEHLTFTKRTLRELRILRHLKHENLIEIRNVFLSGSKANFEDIYVVSELMETDLTSILKSPQPLSNDHCQFFLYQILRGTKYIHSAEVIHRDLKPRNLLVNSNCDLKICDYGLARVKFSNEEFLNIPMTEYVCTRWYRAPEVLCSWPDHGKSIDVWSIGCIFAEMLRRKPLFPGKNTQHQLQLIIQCLGFPEKDVIRRAPNDKCRKFLESLPSTNGRALEDMVPTSEHAADVLNKTLRFNPDERITVEQVLEVPYLDQLHCPEDEPSRTPLDFKEFEFERRKIDIDALRTEIFHEALLYYPDKADKYFQEQARNGTTYKVVDYRLLNPGESQYSSDEEDDQ